MEFLNEECKNHPRKQAYGRCAGCWQFFCDKCLTERNGYQYCHDCVVKVPVQTGGDAGSDPPSKKKPKVPQWLMFGLIIALSALLLDIFYLHWGVIGDITYNNQVLYKAKSYGTLLGSFKKIRTEHFIIYYHDDQAGEIVSQQVEPDFQRICADLLIDPKGLMRRGKFLVILTGSDKEYMNISNEKSASAGALTDYGTKSVIISVERSSPTMTSTLPHELTHTIVYEFMNSGNKIPNWLHEGIASYEEAKFDDSQVTKRNAYIPDLQQGQRMPLSSMALPEDAETTQIQLYYTQAYSVVSYMVDTYGMYKFMTFLKKLQTGGNIDAALAEAYSGDIPNVGSLETKWLEHIGA